MDNTNTNTPKVVNKSSSEIEPIIDEINLSSLSCSTKSFCILCIRTACWLPSILQKKNISISRLKAMILGKKKKKGGSSGNNEGDNGVNNNDGHANGSESATNGEQSMVSSDNTSDSNDNIQLPAKSPLQEPKKGKNKGRNGHNTYENANIIFHTISDVQAGDPCRTILCKGKFYELPAGIIVVIDGQPMARATKHIVEKYRCNLCHLIVKAEVPKDLAGKQKVYTSRFIAQLAMHKFYLGIPYHRFDKYHKTINFPLPDSTQWDLIEKMGGSAYPVFHELAVRLSNGKLVQNDDTVLRILEVITENKNNPTINRKGSFTTCLLGAEETHPIVLYFNGRHHSGENLDAVLANRDEDKPQIIQMSDALACNTPKTIATVACYCLSHGFRKIDELAEFFPKSCFPIMTKLAKVFANDKETKELSDVARMLYHQQNSGPILHACYDEIESILEDPRTEPNGELAKALRYLKKHWVKLTRFLSVPGAPIDNNIVERALKLAIRIRKNSLFYKSNYSAGLSGVLQSLIETSIASNINPVDYLAAIHTYAHYVQNNPSQWLPWTYQDTLKRLDLNAETAASIPQESPVDAGLIRHATLPMTTAPPVM